MTVAKETRFKETEVGLIPEDWRVGTLGKLTDNFDFRRVPIKESERQTGSYPYYGASGVIDYVSEYIFDGEYLLIAEDGENLHTRATPIAFVARGRFWVNNHAHVVRGNGSADTRFIMYALLVANIDAFLTGTTVPKLSQESMNAIPVPFPPLAEQRSITKILSDLDFRIELNQRMNKTLEATGRAIFKHWFIDFEFPNAEGKPYRSSGGEMVYNGELDRELPKGWEVKLFSEVIAVNPRRELPAGKTAKKVGMADLKPWQAAIPDWSSEKYRSGPKFRNGDTLFARITPSLEHGKTALVSFLNDDEFGFGSTEFIVFGKKVVSSKLYIFHLARSPEIRTVAINAMTGSSGRQRVPDAMFDALPIALPPTIVLDQFERTCSPLFDRISTSSKNAKMLSQIRESLLPKLMSGKLRVLVEVR